MTLLSKVDELKQRRKSPNSGRPRVRQPVVLKGISPSKRITVSPDMFRLLDVDLRYQRDRMDRQVGDLIEAIRQGGLVPDPVTLVKRTYEHNGKLWVIDGQQRTWAFLELNRAFFADVHDAESLEAERNFFIVMQERHRLGANQVVESWAGASAIMLRAVASQSGHPMAGQVTFRGPARRFGAAVAIRAIAAVATGKIPNGKVDHVLQTADAAVSNGRLIRARADGILQLLPDVFAQNYVKLLPVVALSLVAYAKWQKHVTSPSRGVVNRLKRINWDADAPSSSRRWLPILVAHVERCWKTA